MNDKIKDTEKISENEEITTEDLDSVAGGGIVDKIKEKWQRFRMSEQEKNEINSLINEYHSLNRRFIGRIAVLAYGGPSWFDENGKSRRRLEEIRNKLRDYAKKYPNIPELEPFRN